MSRLFVSLLLVFMAVTVSAGETHEKKPLLRVLELFTSHGCSSCPPADRLLGELIEDDTGLMALEFHVDYWDKLVYGSAGSFQDPFSSPAFTDRQRAYNHQRLEGRPGVYTPQAIINGRVALVGSSRHRIKRALASRVVQDLYVELQPTTQSGVLQLELIADPDVLEKIGNMDVTLYRYRDSTVTEITGGENKGLSLTNHHVVVGVQTLGSVRDVIAQSPAIQSPDVDEGCVVLVQNDALTPIHAAARCP